MPPRNINNLSCLGWPTTLTSLASLGSWQHSDASAAPQWHLCLWTHLIGVGRHLFPWVVDRQLLENTAEYLLRPLRDSSVQWKRDFLAPQPRPVVSSSAPVALPQRAPLARPATFTLGVSLASFSKNRLLCPLKVCVRSRRQLYFATCNSHPIIS